MRTVDEINLDYEKAMAQVEELHAIADDLKKVGDNSMNECMQVVRNNWKGDNADAYMKKGERLREKVIDSAGDVSEVAGAVKAIADSIKKADLEAYAVVQRIAST